MATTRIARSQASARAEAAALALVGASSLEQAVVRAILARTEAAAAFKATCEAEAALIGLASAAAAYEAASPDARERAEQLAEAAGYTGRAARAYAGELFILLR